MSESSSERVGPNGVVVWTDDADGVDKPAWTALAHLGRKNTVETVGGERQGGRLVFAYGTGTVRPEDNHLVLEAAAEDPDSLAHVEDVLGSHLERFGAKRELVVTWQRGSADSAGSADGIGGRARCPPGGSL